MGMTAKVLQFVRTVRNGAKVTDVRVDTGGGALRTAEHMQPAGTDSHPLPGDFAQVDQTQGTGRFMAVGYLDPLNLQSARAGEWRAYSRDEETGEQVAEIWAKNDGAVTANNANGSYTLNPDGAQALTNANGTIRLLADGSVNINGFIISPDGIATDSAGVVSNTHTHAQGQDSAGNTQAETEAPTQ